VTCLASRPCTPSVVWRSVVSITTSCIHSPRCFADRARSCNRRGSVASCATTAPQPCCAFEYLDIQSDAERNFLFEILSERDAKRSERSEERGDPARQKRRSSNAERGGKKADGPRVEPRSATDPDGPARPLRRRAVGTRTTAIERVFKPTLHHLADRIGARLRAKSLSGRTITVRVRFADLRSVTRSRTLSAPISATRALAGIAEDLVRGVLADHHDEKTISLLAIAVSNLEAHPIVQMELPLGLAGDGCRPGTKQGLARLRADQAIDAIRNASEDKRWTMRRHRGLGAPSLTSSDA
jgi:hypothetical protein